VHIIGCAFQNNSASAFGGAIYAKGAGADLITSDNTFDDNVAGDGGGAIYVSGVSQLIVSTSDFTSNTTSSLEGGAIDDFGTIVSVTDSTFKDNMGPSAGAIFNSGSTASPGTLDVYNSTFDGNTASPGISAKKNWA